MQFSRVLVTATLCAVIFAGGHLSRCRGQLIVDSDATINYEVAGGELHFVENASGQSPTIMVVEPALVQSDARAFNSSVINVLGGEFRRDLIAHDNSVVNVLGGRFRDDLRAQGESLVNLFGGEVEDGTVASDSAAINVLGGSYWSLVAVGNGVITVRGGTMAVEPDYEIFTSGSGVIIFHGTEFNFPYGVITDATGVLTGVLSSGDPIAAEFIQHENGKILLVPEPSTLAMMLAALPLGYFAFRRRRSLS
jgi:PEP-CTERM motif-containing protein